MIFYRILSWFKRLLSLTHPNMLLLSPHFHGLWWTVTRCNMYNVCGDIKTMQKRYADILLCKVSKTGPVQDWRGKSWLNCRLTSGETWCATFYIVELLNCLTSGETCLRDIEKTQIMRCRRCVLCVNIIFTSTLGPAIFLNSDGKFISGELIMQYSFFAETDANTWSKGSSQFYCPLLMVILDFIYIRDWRKKCHKQKLALVLVRANEFCSLI